MQLGGPMLGKRKLLPFLLASILMAQAAAEPTQTKTNAPFNGVDETSEALDKNAQTPELKLNRVIVTAMKEALAIEDSGATIAHFGESEIDRLNATSLSDLLMYEPGVSVDESKSGGLSDIRIRGIGDDRVLILVDGAPLPQTYSFGSYLGTNRNYFDLDAMKSVDIVKGPMSTLYGGSALAGGIFMMTKDPSDYIKPGEKYGGEAKIGYRSASRETLLSGTGAANFNNDLSAFLRLTYKKQHERANHHGDGAGNSQLGPNRLHPDPSDSSVNNLLTKWVFEPNSEHKFSATYEYFREDVDVDPKAKIGDITFGMFKQLALETNDINKRQQLTFRHDFNLKTPLFDQGFWQLYFQKNSVEQRSFEVREMIKGGMVTERDRLSTFDNKSLGLGAEFTKLLETQSGITHNVTYGLSVRQNRVSTERTGDTRMRPSGQSVEREAFPNKSFPDSTIREYGLFIQDRIGLMEDKIELIAGLRFDHYRLNPKTGTAYESANPGVLPPAKVSKSQFSKRFALLYHPNDEHTLFVNYSEGFRAPTFGAVNVGFSNPAVGYTSRSNPNLKAETSKLYELGWNYTDEKHSVALTGFYTTYNNFIDELSSVGKDPESGYIVYQAVNLDKSYIYGLEAKARFELMEVQNGHGSIGLNVSAAYAKGKDKKTKEPINGVDPLTLTMGLDYRFDESFYVGARVKMVKAKKASEISTSMKETGVGRAPGYGTLDLVAEYKPTDDITINAGIYNVFDKKHWSWGDRMMQTSPGSIERGSKPGINAALSIKIDF